jgi:hypothetical protein
MLGLKCIPVGVLVAALLWAWAWVLGPAGNMEPANAIGRFLTWSAIVGLMCSVPIYFAALAYQALGRRRSYARRQ